MIALVTGREFILFDFFTIAAQRLQGIGLQMRVGLHEFGSELIEEA